MSHSRFRQRKLNVKTSLQILREDDLEALVDATDSFLNARANDPLSSLPKVESGVESKEEKEHHLQAVINATQSAAVGGKIDQIYIPTPDALPAVGVDYDKLYPKIFAQPATYIRFSSTVEDCIGCPYCMTGDDETFLKITNEKAAQQVQTQGKKRDAKGNVTSPVGAAAQCNEDQFEAVMNFFEEASAAKQPFASVDNTPVLEFTEMENLFDESLDDSMRKFAKEIYDYWKEQRSERGNKPLMPTLKTLKLEGSQEADDSDPYICFRRREVRQARKTRGRDAQVAEKLRRLRKELEDARNLVNYVRQREHAHKISLEQDKEVYQKRSTLRELRRTLTLTGHEDDELLITQKTPKKKPEPAPGAMQAQSGRMPAGALRMGSQRADGLNLPEMQLTMLSERLAARDAEIGRAIQIQVDKHEQWNLRFVDRTLEAALGLYTPTEEEGRGDDFVTIKAGYGYSGEPRQQPTPPPSNPALSPSPRLDPHDDARPVHSLGDKRSTGELSEAEEIDEDKVMVTWDAPSSPEYESLPRYRRRVGRGGRLMLDRHNFKMQQETGKVDARQADRFKYDHDEGDYLPDKPIDIFSSTGFRYRSFWAMGREQQQAHNQQVNPNKDAHRRQMSAAQQQQQQQQQQSPSGRDVAMTNGQSTAGAQPQPPPTKA